MATGSWVLDQQDSHIDDILSGRILIDLDHPASGDITWQQLIDAVAAGVMDIQTEWDAEVARRPKKRDGTPKAPLVPPDLPIIPTCQETVEESLRSFGRIPVTNWEEAELTTILAASHLVSLVLTAWARAENQRLARKFLVGANKLPRPLPPGLPVPESPPAPTQVAGA